ncbi:MAG: hypothetical protein LBE56_02165 [Tannerella sp.]|jgi:hypothetical protein|nr:hypothetical protein [Tannerella sp.]
MNLIKNNPYRNLGLLAGASARDINRQANRLQKIITAEQEPPTDDFSFSSLGSLTRTTTHIEDAIAQLNLDSDKMNAALFWFWNGNPRTDEVAFEALKEGNAKLAFQIWDRLMVDTKEDGKRYWRTVSEKNSSAFHNCFVLEMLRVGGNKHTAIMANLYFLESEFSKKFISTIVDRTHSTSTKELQLNFLNEFLQEMKSGHTNLSPDKFIAIIKSIDFTAKPDFLKNMSQKVVSGVSAKIEAARKKRTDSKSEAASVGEELLQQTKNDLEQLKSIVGEQDFAYSNIADKVANELLQCGVDYFLEYRDTSTDPGKRVMALFQKAKSIAVGNVSKERINENVKTLQDWVNDKPQREKEQLVRVDLKFITDKIEQFQQLTNTVPNAKDLALSCKPKLEKIKTTLGAKDDLYLKLSSAVVGNSQGMLVLVVNAAQEKFKILINLDRNIAIDILKTDIKDSIEVINYLNSFDMDSATRERYNSNKSVLRELAGQLNISVPKSASYSGSSSSKSRGGCYIATMAYGSYEHPQVLMLRQFRDEVLAQSMPGRLFIKCYYHYSPKLVKVLKNKQFINKLIRNILNQFIKVIK